MFVVTTFSQKNNPKTALIKEDYLQKSKKQKTVGWILLGGGATFVLTGIIIPKGDIVHETILGYDYENDGIKGAFQLTGILSMIGSIPFFTASKKNSKRAMSFSFRNETAPQLVKSNFVYRPIPSLTFKIGL
jgi:hypothetical protein